MSVKNIIFLSIFLLSLCSLVVHFNFKKIQKKQSVIIISVDTLRADHMGIYGYPKKTTPFIDAWFKNGLIFTNMHTIVPSTYPSFVTLMTGKSPFESKIFSNLDILHGTLSDDQHQFQQIPPQTPLLAEIFKENGYKTAAFVTNGVLNGKLTGLGRGFDLYKIQGRGFDRENIDGITHLSTNTDYKRYKNIFTEAEKWVNVNKNKNFFLWIHIMDPHSPYIPDKEYTCSTNENFCSQIKMEGLGNLEKLRNSLAGCQNTALSTEHIELFKTLYDGSIKSVDSMVGNFLRGLDQTHITDNTIVLLYSDHGEGFDHNVYFEHINDIYESHTHIPFLVKHADVTKGKITAMLDNTAIFPLILKLAGIDTNDTLSTRSIPQAIYAVNYNLTKYSITQGSYKYIYSLPSAACFYENSTQELYDLIKDPSETHNIFSEQKVKALKQNLFSYLQKYGLPKEKELLQPSSTVENNEIIHMLKSLGY